VTGSLSLFRLFQPHTRLSSLSLLDSGCATGADIGGTPYTRFNAGAGEGQTWVILAPLLQIDPLEPNLSQILRLLAHTYAFLRVKLKIIDSLPIGLESGQALR
jgi:hypothetical protein